MFVNTVESAPHVRVSRTLDRVAHFARETREHRTERRRLNRHASKSAARVLKAKPRLVKPQPVQTISLVDFIQSAQPVVEVERIELLTPQVVSFDKREAVAQQAGL